MHSTNSIESVKSSAALKAETSLTKSSSPSSSSHIAITTTIAIVVPLLTALIAMTAPIMLALIPTALLPAVVLYMYYNKAAKNSPSRVKSSKLLTVFLLSGTIGTLIVIVVQSILTYLAGIIIFGAEVETYMKEFARSENELEHASSELIAKRAHMAAQPRYWIFMFVLMFDIVATTEELLKYISLPLTLKYLLQPPRSDMSINGNETTINGNNDADADADTDTRRALLGGGRPRTLEKAYIPIIVAATLGFSTLENIGFLYAAAVTSSEPPLRLLQTTLERLFLSAPGHVLTALYISAAMIQRDFRNDDNDHRTTITITTTTNTPEPSSSSSSPLLARITRRLPLRILAIPIIFHGAFDFVLLAISALNGNVGWVHPRDAKSTLAALAAILGLQITLALIVRAKWVRYDISL